MTDRHVVVAGAGVAGLETALALQALAEGLVSVELEAPETEFTYRPLAVAEPFRVGEEIEVGNFNGVVQEIQTRATLLRTWDGFLVVIPNSCIYTEKLTVLNAYDARRTTLSITCRGARRVACAPSLLCRPGMTMSRPRIIPA